MAVETRDREIAGVTYRVTMLPALVGRKFLIRITKTIAPSVAVLLGSLGGKDVKKLADLNLDKVGDALAAFMENVTEAEFEAMCDEFAKRTEYAEDGGASDTWPNLSKTFSDHFAGKYDRLIAWFAFCLEVNFGGFFDASGAFGDVAARLRSAKVPTPPGTSNSPTE